MIRIKPFKQSKGFCGPACLKMVLAYYGVYKSEQYLARLTKTTRMKGCDELNIVRAAKKFGMKGYVKQRSTIKELKAFAKNGIPVIVDWFSPEEESHYSVVLGFKDDNIFLADPHFGKVKKHKIEWFEKRWYDVVNKRRIVKEMIVLFRATKEPENKVA